MVLTPRTRLSPCPACAELIDAEVRRCPHCAADMPEKTGVLGAAARLLSSVALASCSVAEPAYGIVVDTDGSPPTTETAASSSSATEATGGTSTTEAATTSGSTGETSGSTGGETSGDTEPTSTGTTGEGTTGTGGALPSGPS